jgi:cardiolipin synthase
VTDAPWFAVGADSVRLLRDGEQAFPTMLDAIASAKSEVLLEMYWIGRGKVGERFRAALAERAAAGVDVRVLYDSVGSFDVSRDWWRALTKAGGAVVEFHVISPFDRRFRFDAIERRDHRKLLVVDHAHAFTGGINLSDEWLPVTEGGAAWRDDMIEVKGYAAIELRALFYKTWRRMTGARPPPDLRPLELRRKRPVWLLANHWRQLRSIHREYVLRIRGATSRVDIANSYFVPDGPVRRALRFAAKRGVHVRVLVPARGDVPVVQLASEALYDRLIRSGVEIYTLPIMLHSKSAIIDDTFTTIGSYNLDQRSWKKNLEANLAVDDRAFASHARKWFEHDLAQATPLDLEAWRTRSALRRGLEWAAFALERFW